MKLRFTIFKSQILNHKSKIFVSGLPKSESTACFILYQRPPYLAPHTEQSVLPRLIAWVYSCCTNIPHSVRHCKTDS